jgi:hypothetical protein
MSLTPDRERVIRTWLSLEGTITGQMTYELFSEIERLRAENDKQRLLNVANVGGNNQLREKLAVAIAALEAYALMTGDGIGPLTRKIAKTALAKIKGDKHGT